MSELDELLKIRDWLSDAAEKMGANVWEEGTGIEKGAIGTAYFVFGLNRRHYYVSITESVDEAVEEFEEYERRAVNERRA